MLLNLGILPLVVSLLLKKASSTCTMDSVDAHICLIVYTCNLEATIGTLGRRAESIVGCEQVSFMLVMWYQRARSRVLWLLWTRQAQIWKSLDISCRQADSRLVTMSHIFVTAFSVVACCVLLSTCSFLSRPLFLWLREGIFDSVTCAH